MTIKRLFDSLDDQLAKFPKDDMLVAKENGKWVKNSTQKVKDTVDAFSKAIMAKGLGGNDMTTEGADKIAIISNNRPEWIFTDMAVQQTGAILIPIYPTTNPLELIFILNDASVKYIFVSSADLFEKVNNIRDKVPSISHIYTFDKMEGATHWSELLNEPQTISDEQLEERKKSISVEHTATIIYTSGTTGTPKGVMLSHRNIFSNVQMCKDDFPFPDAPHAKVLSFLPLNHIFEKTASYIYLFSGISIYYAESLETIGDNLKEIKPDGFSSVPRLLEKVFEKIMSKGNELSGIKRKLFFWAIGLADKYDNNKSGGFLYDMQLSLANKLIFSKWREALGGNISFIITGGAACQVKLLRMFNAGGIPVYEGYGPTENSPVISVNGRSQGDMVFGSVGRPLKGQEVKLAEDGEILVKGPSVMKGYYKRPDLTAETVIDGWLLTGDIGVWVGDFLKITDRKKEMFKTSGGKYVAPQPIENKLKESPYIEQVIVVGADRKFVGALIVPSLPLLREWMAKNNMPFTTPEDAFLNREVQLFFRDLVESFNKYFNHVEQIKKFELLPREWSIESGEMTPKMSLKRKVIMEKFKTEVDRIYGD